MFSKLKNWFKSKYIFVDEVVKPAQAATHEVDTRDIETRKRVRKAFEAQEQQMNIRALKAHDPACKDPLTCKKRKCFKWEPDKIVSEPYEINREMIIKEEEQRQIESMERNSLYKNASSFIQNIINDLSQEREELYSLILLCLEYGKNNQLKKMKSQIIKIKNHPRATLQNKPLQKVIAKLELIASSKDH